MLRGLLLVLLVASSCTLVETSTRECVSTSDCQQAFGLGSRCADDGFCDLIEVNPRCGRTFPERAFEEPWLGESPVLFGSLLDRSQSAGRGRENAFRLALEQIDTVESESVSPPFVAVFCTIEEDAEFDGLLRSDAALEVAQYLEEEVGVVALFGPSSSDDVSLVFSAREDDELVLMTPSATSPALTGLDPIPATDDAPGHLWRTAPPDSLQGEAIALDMRSPGAGRAAAVTRVAVLYDQGIYGSALADVFVETFTELGGEATGFPFSSSAERSESTAQASLGDFEEVLFIHSQATEVVAFLNSIEGLSGFDDKRVFLTDAAATTQVLNEASAARFNSIRGTRPGPGDTNDITFASFLASYASEYNEDATQLSFVAHAYDAAWLLASAAVWAGTHPDVSFRQQLARGLRKLSAGPRIDVLPSSWDELSRRIRDDELVDLQGASGDLDFDSATEETSGRIETWIIKDGAFEGIDSWPKS